MATNDHEDTDNVIAGEAPRAGRREWIGLAVLALPTLLIGLDMTALHLAVPSLSSDLAPTSTQLLWITDVYGFMIAGFLITMGTLGDRIGRRRLLMIGGAAFGLSSMLAAFSSGPEMLVVSRALLGVAGATLMPSTLALISTMFRDPEQRTLAVSVWMMCLLSGTAVGPLAGGVLLEFFWWGSVFLLAVPVMALLLAAGPVFLPEYRDPRAGRLDLISVGLWLAAVLPAVYGLKEAAKDGPSWTAALTISASLGFGVLFVRRQRWLPDPMLDLGLFADRVFGGAMTAHALSAFFLVGMQFMIAQHLQLVLGLSPLEAGLWTLPGAVGGIFGSLLAPALVRRVRPAFGIAGGLVFGAAGFALFARVEADSGLPILVAGYVTTALAVGLVTTLTTDLIISAAPPERTGAASGIEETGIEFGIAMGVAVLGSIGTAVYRNRLAGTIPEGTPPEAREAAADTLGGAVAAAERLPGRPGADLLDAAREAFVQGLQLNAALSVAVMVGLAILTAVLLRRVPAHSGRDGASEPGRHGATAADQRDVGEGDRDCGAGSRVGGG